MNGKRVLVALGIGLLLLAARPAGALSIGAVEASPPQPDDTTPVSLRVTFSSGSPVHATAPIAVAIEGFSIDVEVFVRIGLTLAAVTETFEVELGVLPAGVYDFAVRFTPLDDPPPPAFTGRFEVVPEPGSLGLLGVGTALMALRVRRRARRRDG